MKNPIASTSQRWLSQDLGRLCFGVALLASLYACPGTHVYARQPEPAVFSSLNIPGFSWQETLAMRMSGVPFYAKHFATATEILSAAQLLMKHAPVFEHVLTLKDKVVLSGLRPGWHWLAEISKNKTGTHGYVSAMRTDKSNDQQGAQVSGHSFAWLPGHALRQFDQQNRLAGRLVTQQIYSIALPVDVLMSSVHEALRKEGWVPEPGLASMGPGTRWNRKGDHLALHAQQGTGGTSLYVHYSQLQP